RVAAVAGSLARKDLYWESELAKGMEEVVAPQTIFFDFMSSRNLARASLDIEASSPARGSMASKPNWTARVSSSLRLARMPIMPGEREILNLHAGVGSAAAKADDEFPRAMAAPVAATPDKKLLRDCAGI